ncbi:MAG: hypothetical protein HW380_879 [Magnetococcales bacterium]|nr:hypothetical protein [Magnetococcales bacterium]
MADEVSYVDYFNVAKIIDQLPNTIVDFLAILNVGRLLDPGSQVGDELKTISGPRSFHAMAHHFQGVKIVLFQCLREEDAIFSPVFQVSWGNIFEILVYFDDQFCLCFQW